MSNIPNSESAQKDMRTLGTIFENVITFLSKCALTVYKHIKKMAIHMHFNKEEIPEKESVLHLMPCKIHGDESAKVSSYFEPYIRKENDECKLFFL